MADFARSDSVAVQAQLSRLALPTHDTLGLERVSALLARLGDPQHRLPPVLHVAGTNGKGSTTAFLRAGIEAAGLTAHVFTSPHLVRFNERIRIAGRLIADDALAALLAEVLDAGEGIGASFFEVTTAAALLAFTRIPADACILEVGLGGRLDATNVVARPAACGIASVGLDHQHYLGHTLPEIAREKAGIAKPGVPLIALAQISEALAATEQMAREQGAPCCCSKAATGSPTRASCPPSPARTSAATRTSPGRCSAPRGSRSASTSIAPGSPPRNGPRACSALPTARSPRGAT